MQNRANDDEEPGLTESGEEKKEEGLSRRQYPNNDGLEQDMRSETSTFSVIKRKATSLTLS